MTEQPPRPPRSLRDRAGARQISDSSAPPTDYIRSEIIEEEVEPEIQAQELIEESIPNPEPEKPKVKVLNVRKVNTDEAKKVSKEKIQAEVKNIKHEIEKVEEIVEEAKEEITKISTKVIQDALLVRDKITQVTLQVADKVITKAKDLVMSLIFRRKKSPTPKKAKSNRVKYSSLVAQKAEFLTYDKKPLIPANMKPGNDYEETFMANAISDIRYCIRFVSDLPAPMQGPYANRLITEIFDNVTPEDINFFLSYVTKNPNPFIGANYKFSEAFATWIIRKSHETPKA